MIGRKIAEELKGEPTKLRNTLISAAKCHRATLLPTNTKKMQLKLIIPHANDLICMFMNFNENIRWRKLTENIEVYLQNELYLSY